MKEKKNCLHWFCCNSPSADRTREQNTFSQRQSVSACPTLHHSHGAVLVSTHLHRAPRSLSPWGERTGSHQCHPLLLSLLRLTAPPSYSSVEGVHISPAFIIPRKQIEKKSMTMCYQILASSFPNCTTKMVLVHSHALTENPYTMRTVLVGVLRVWPFLLHCIFSH